MPDESVSGVSRLSEPPYGISPRHLAMPRAAWLRPLLTLLLIGGPLLAGMLGWLGGGGERVSAAVSPQARVEVVTPGILRSGNWFETQVRITPRVAVSDLAVAFDEDLWHFMSIDSLLPDAESAEFGEGRFTFHFGPVKPGDRFVLKIDGQIQPRWFRSQSGRVRVLDDKRELASQPISLTVLP